MIAYLKNGLRSKALLPTLIVLAAILALLALPDHFINPAYERYEACKARVLTVDNSAITHAGVVAYGEQSCEIELLNGAHRGETFRAMNMLTGSLSTDKIFVPGDIALAMVGSNAPTGIFKATMVDHYRIEFHTLLALALVVILVAIAGWIGLRAILSFVFTILCIWKVLIPLLLRGYDPILISLGIVLLLACAIILLVYGFDRRSLAVIAGSLLGTGLTALLSILFVRLLDIHGAVMEYSEGILYAGYSLNLTEIFISSVFIGSSGALMDIAVDITSAVREVVLANPAIGRKGALKAGMNVGRAALGTMTTTLLLAYSGGYLGILMVFVAQGTPLINILNLNYISAEILNTLVGSFGLVTVAPFTAIMSSFLLTRPKKDASLKGGTDMQPELPAQPTEPPAQQV